MPHLKLAFNLPIQGVFIYWSDLDIPLGCRVLAEIGRRRLTGWVVGSLTDRPPELKKIKTIIRAVDSDSLFDEDFLSLAQWMADLTLCSLGEALACMLPSGRREGKGITDGEEAEVSKSVDKLTSEQNKALDAIKDSPQDWFYLYGKTGSGKTEVFLRAAEDSISRGEGVIYLVPEIALSHQLVAHLSDRFSDNIAVLHSGLTPSQRLNQWRKIQKGEALLTLGARSAVFAPVRNLGLVIIDEEHEGSYKSSSTPRYHARQLAMRRCLTSKGTLIMGSATPSVEAWFLMNSGRLRRLELLDRPAGGAQPRIRVVDMRREKGVLSQEMLKSLSATLNQKRQALLFLNRRGFSYHYFCPDCGEDILCRNCSVPLTYHKNRHTMLCHYCGHRRLPPDVCPNCKSLQMRATGFGTEKIEEEIRKLYPEKHIVRLDADTTRRKGVLASTLKDFRTGKIDILLGTQMVAKGLNAPGLQLAVILAADTTMNLPDFRSTERTFALIVQVAGRVGRFRPDGEVLIQTYRPDAVPVEFAANNRIAEFYKYEISQRHLLGFPPHSRLFRLVVRGKSEERVRTYINALTKAMSHGKDRWELLGPAECPIGLMAGEFRQHLIVRTNHFDHAHSALKTAIIETKAMSGVRLEIDLDPVGLL